MDAEFLYKETLMRVAPRELTPTERVKLQFACEKTIMDYPRRNLETHLLTTISYLNYILSFPDLNL